MILTGDFNTAAGGGVHKAFLDSGLQDTRALAAKKEGPEGTFHGFKGTLGDTRIDWILVTPGFKVARNETITFNRDGRFPSDHFPIVTELTLPPVK